jgi:large subunit ribosomal protein L25
MTFILDATPRTERGKKLAKARNAGKLPAVVYGAKEKSTAFYLDRISFEKVFKQAGESSIITLKGLEGDKEVLVHDVAFDPSRGGIIHVDFYAIEAGKEITVDVPLTFVGEAPALKLGGTLTKVLHEIEVTCKPKDLPKEITVDVASLVDFEAQIHVSDLTIPAGVTVGNAPDDVVALVQAVEEEKEEAPAAIDMSAIEVEKKGKEEALEEGAPAA